MSDVRLIDANALEKFLNEKVKTLADQNGWHDHYVSGFDDAITYVEDAPTIDAVPVVRCRECEKHRDRESKLGIHWCDKWGNVVRDMDFCSFGERKMDGGAE